MARDVQLSIRELRRRRTKRGHRTFIWPWPRPSLSVHPRALEPATSRLLMCALRGGLAQAYRASHARDIGAPDRRSVGTEQSPGSAENSLPCHSGS